MGKPGNLYFTLGMLLFSMLLSACDALTLTKDFSQGTICLPYRVSNKKTSKTIFVNSFTAIYSAIDANITFHVLKDSNEASYVILEGNEDIINRINCSTAKDYWYEEYTLNITYEKCIRESRLRTIDIDIYGHTLYEIMTRSRQFICTDTLRSHVGSLRLYQLYSGIFQITCNIPTIMAKPNHDYNIHGNFILSGYADSCDINLGPGLNAPIINLRNLNYNSLKFVTQGCQYDAYVGRPKKIYYTIDAHCARLFYQGDPELISVFSKYDNVVREGP